MMYPFYDPEMPLNERIKDLLSRLTIEEKINFIPTRNIAIERLGIQAWGFGGEGAHGYVNREGNNTTFPQTIGLAAGWDRELLRKIGEAVGTEARFYYKNHERKQGLAIWSPTIDMERHPGWGRTEEGYGEDPYLTSELSCEYIRGVQGDHPFYLRASCGPKHFVANNNEENRAACSCSIPPQLLHEYYLVPFKAAVKKAGAVSLMTSYNEVNGIPMMMHPILKDIVKNDWGLSGNIVTDGGDFLQTVDMHHYFETHDETVAAALKNGADCMTDMPEAVIKALKDALDKKLIDEAEIDKHLERIFAIRFRLGQFDPPELCPYEFLNETDALKEEYSRLSRDAVRKSAVLLKNENDILPLRPETINKNIVVMGPLADQLHLDWYSGRPTYFSTPMNGLKELYDEKIKYTECRDIVSFSAKDGRPMILVKIKDKSNLDHSTGLPIATKRTFTAGAPEDKPARFYMDDWGWGVKTFTDTESGLMLVGCYARHETAPPPQREPIPPELMPKNDTTVYTITATGKNNLEWFGFTLFNVVPQENGLVLLKTHDNRRVAAAETGVPVNQHDSPLPAEGELFKMKLERDGLTAAVESAARAGQVIFFAGNDPMVNGRECIDRPSLNLPPRQEELIRRVAEVNPRVILILLSGYPFTCGEIAKNVPAILWMAHGIQETGNGIADIIGGSCSPSGRSPFTWYKDEKQLPSLMEYDIQKSGITYQYLKGPVIWPFGHGLTYTNFEYYDLSIDRNDASKDDTVSVSFKIKNTGTVISDEVPQMYVSISGSVYKRPIKTLKNFTRLSFLPNEEKTINFYLPVSELSIWDNFKNYFVTETCYCNILIGTSSANIKLSGGFNVWGENPYPRKLDFNAYPANQNTEQPETNFCAKICAQSFDDYFSCYLHEKRGSGIPAVFNGADNYNNKTENNEKAGWIRFKSIDFASGVSKFSAVVQGRYNCRIEIRLDAPDGLLAGTIDVPNTGDISFYPLPMTSYRRLPSWGYAECNLENTSGVHDIYLLLYGKTGLWQFAFGK